MTIPTQNQTLHKSVLTKEVLTYLSPQPHGIYVDATFGGGGHTRAILESEPTCKVIALDWDQDSLDRHAPPLQEEFGERLTIVWGNFAHLEKLLHKQGIKSIHGIIADLGTSQYQIFEKSGFSFLQNTPLDMRMSPAHQRKTAADILNHYSPEDLARVFYEYGEIYYSRALAQAIVTKRQHKQFSTTKQLIDVIMELVKGKEAHRRTHPATKAFQALRIEVNQELENIMHFLNASVKVLASAGRLVCISFHSLEDRIVKHFFREHKVMLEILTPKPILASPEELTANPSARSAKLRAAEKL